MGAGFNHSRCRSWNSGLYGPVAIGYDPSRAPRGTAPLSRRKRPDQQTPITTEIKATSGQRLLVNAARQIQHFVLPHWVGAAHQFDISYRASLRRNLVENTASHDAKSNPRKYLLNLIRHSEIDIKARCVRMRGTLDQRGRIENVRRAFRKHDSANWKAFEVLDVAQHEWHIDGHLAPSDTPTSFPHFSRKLNTLCRQNLVVGFAELFLSHEKRNIASADRSHVVRQDLALPFWIGQIAPALRLLARRHKPVIEQQSIINRHNRRLEAIVLERGVKPCRIGYGLVTHDGFVFDVENYGLVLRIEHDVAEIAAGGLFGTNAFTHFAGARLKYLHQDSIPSLESLGDRLGGRSAHQRGIEH